MNRRLLRLWTVVAVLTTTCALAVSASAQQALEKVGNVAYAVSESPNGIYIVQMTDNPVVAYKGGVKGLKATKPKKGKKIDPNSPAVINYVGYLTAKHDAALAKVGGGKKTHGYHYSFNGFAAKLSLEQAKKLISVDGIRAVSADELQTTDTATTPDFLRLTDSGGLWDQLGGAGSAGEDIIIGIIDSGIWPESASFSDRTGANGNAGKDGKLSYHRISGWHGKCEPGEEFNASHCNQKLIGARYFNASWGGDAGIEAQRPWEFTSPRDYDGHGTHTASTAGGNNDVEVTGPAALFGSVSGIAPRARIAAYKALWSTEDASTASGFTGDLIAAIDQAVADGVDVINYSVSGTSTNFLTPVQISFMFAADAGIFVAASAGNSGPGESTVAHPGPWLTTVAASTHDRNYEAEVKLGDGATYSGSSVNTAGAGPADLVYSANVGLGGEDLEEIRLCYPGTLDPAQVTGKIVLCDRGIIARVDKSLAVFVAGGIGSILANSSAAQTLNADFHSVPTVHVTKTDGDVIRTYATTDTAPTAEIFPSYSAPVSAPVIAGFSSRGPLLAGDGDLLKPDVSAPGVDIVAAVAPPGNGGEDFGVYSGTSMSSPHVAGLAALLTDLHPDWSPMMIKSALMTTGYDLLSGPDPFAQGAGHVAPKSAADPGLVYDHGWNDWLGFLCGTGELQAGFCSVIGIDPSDLNVASISIGALVGAQTVTRTVTNVGSVSEEYTFFYSLPGVDVVAAPPIFTVAPGESVDYTLTFTATTAALGSYTSGFVTWNGDGHSVRSPIAVKPVYFSAPAEIAGSGETGSASFDVSFGYTGDYTAAAHGLEPAERQADTVEDDPTNNFNSALSTCDWSSFPYQCTGITWHLVTVPVGMVYTRFALFDEYTDGADDLDLYVWGPGGFFGGSGSGTSAEEVNALFPVPGDYEVAVHGWGTDGPDANYTLFDWSVRATPGGNLSVDSAPASAVLGSAGSVDVSWSGLVGAKHLGAVSHSDSGGVIGLTLISVDTD